MVAAKGAAITVEMSSTRRPASGPVGFWTGAVGDVWVMTRSYPAAPSCGMFNSWKSELPDRHIREGPSDGHPAAQGLCRGRGQWQLRPHRRDRRRGAVGAEPAIVGAR